THPSKVEEWWELGVRLIGPAWAGNVYCGGTGEPGPLTKLGFELLENMAACGMVLDLSHMDETAALQALDTYPKTIIASHANAKALLKGSDSNRHLSDLVIQRIIERDGIIGVVPFNVFLKTGWKSGDNKADITLDHVVAQIDHICQIAGNAKHAALGTDFDGGFGRQSVPREIDTIADLTKISELLLNKGYSVEDVGLIMGRNWLTMLLHNLPE
ncbi:MAG: dipeptidase, partial [Anaerolineales bacterium]